MRVSRTQAAENRQTVINVAGRLFRRHGFDGIGLKDLMKGAGLTQGAFYKQFASKEDLVAQATRRALESAERRWANVIAANPKDPLGAVVDLYLSPKHREEKTDGCPLVALGSDAARQSSDVKASFEAGIKSHLEILRRLIGEAGGDKPDDQAMAVFATIVGAQILARAVNDRDLAQALLDSAADQVRAAVPPRRPRSRRRKTQDVRQRASRAR
jgi:TetR/AcrR family transcriptional regulator, transcriptional repressor for nem operon